MASGNPLSVYIAIKFVQLIVKPFTEWESYKLGLIDAKGKKIREPATRDEQKYFTSWLNLVRNIKRMLLTVPGGSSKFASFATAFALLKDHVSRDLYREVLTEDLICALEDSDSGLISDSLILESRDRGPEYLEPGDYMLLDGPDRFTLEESGHPITFTVTKRIFPVDRVFGVGIFELINTDRRTLSCAGCLQKV